MKEHSRSFFPIKELQSAVENYDSVRNVISRNSWRIIHDMLMGGLTFLDLELKTECKAINFFIRFMLSSPGQHDTSDLVIICVTI